ncbi:MAG: hypothetical protein V3U97_01205, partial [bacterium]
ATRSNMGLPSSLGSVQITSFRPATSATPEVLGETLAFSNTSGLRHMLSHTSSLIIGLIIGIIMGILFPFFPAEKKFLITRFTKLLTPHKKLLQKISIYDKLYKQTLNRKDFNAFHWIEQCSFRN